MAASPLLNLNGYTPLPAGKVACVVTYLEMRSRPIVKREAKIPSRCLERLADVARYRQLFRQVGEDWLWFSRLTMPANHLASLLAHPKIEAYALVDQGADVGILELDFRSRNECELAFFGLIPEAIGKGHGRFLIGEAIKRAFRQPIRRLFVHTCSLDHPAALSFYRKAGFSPYKQAIEVADDPRLTGLMVRGAATQVPLFAPKGKAGKG